MSILQVKEAGVFVPVGGSDAPVDDWVRPTDWLALPAVTSTAAGTLIGLVAVFEGDNNWVAVTCAGAYTVDWGDGTAPQNVATGVKAERNIAWANVSSGTLTSRGYRQAVVTIIPQGGFNMTSVTLNARATVVASGTASQWLDITMAGTSVSVLAMSGTAHPAAMLERFEYVGSSAITTSVPAFTTSRRLRSVVGTAWTSGVTNFTNMFYSCPSLQTIPLLDTGGGKNFSSMFAACPSLQTIPLLDTGAGTNFSSMFAGCSALQAVPLLNTAAGTTFTGMFNACSSLQTVPLLNTGGGKNFTQMFFSCYSLQTVPLLDTGGGTNFTQMFSTCSSLQTIPLLDTAAGTAFAAMFSTCPALQTVPLLNTAAGADFTSMFFSCYSLQTVPLLDTGSGTNFTGMFNACSSLQTVPLLNTGAGTTFTNMFANCPSLQVGALSGTTKTISYVSCKLSAAQLDAIYTNLASGVTAQTITVTGNPGVAGDDPTIATSKGWTCVG